MAGFRPLLEARVAAELAGIDRDGDGPVTWWTESVEAWPGIAGNVRRLAQALEVAGHGAAAAAGYASALDANPFDWEARASAAALAARRQDATRLAGLIAEGRRLAAIAPECAERAAALEALAGDGLAVRLPS
jgi:hypothetical protein